MRRVLQVALTAAALTLAAAAPAVAGTDSVTPGKACAHANLTANRSFDANHTTGVDGNGTPPTCRDAAGQ